MAAKRAPTPRPVQWRKHAFLIGALWLAALAAYSNSFRAGLAFDSQRLILADSRIQADTADNIRQIWTGDYYNGTGSGALYRPLTTLTFLWNYADLGGGYHIVNFALHAANMALVYFLGLALFGEAWAAFAMAALWGLHPILTEAVTNVAGRADLLAGFGVLAGLLCYLRGRNWWWLPALAACAAIAVFSKESGIVLVAVMIAAQAISPRFKPSAYVAVLIPGAVWFAMRHHALSQVSSLLVAYTDNPLQAAGFWISRLTAVKVLGWYLWLLVWPAHLSPDYSYHQIPLSTWSDPKALLALVVWMAIAAAAIFGWRRARPLFFLMAFFAVTIAPVANIVILVGSIMAERFLYVPSVAFAGALVWGARALRARVPPRAIAAALAAVSVGYVVRTGARNADWFDDRALWASAVQVCPDSYKPHQNLAMLALALSQPDYSAATRQVERALAILDPLPDGRNMPGPYVTAGQCYRARGDLNRALAVLERGRNIDRAWNAAFQERNRADGKTVPTVGTPPLYLELGRVYAALSQPEKAIDAFREGRAIDPELPFFEEMSHVYIGLGQPDRAAISLLEGIAVSSSQTALLNDLTQLYQTTAPASCALRRTATGTTINLNCPLVHDQLCTASANMAEMFTAMHDPASAGAIAQNAARNYGCSK